MTRRIAHLDMDAFYASVELLRYPQLRGLPVVVGGRRRRESDYSFDSSTPIDSFARLRDYVGRGVATTASYEARALGVHSALGLMKAAVMAPNAILLPADFEEYSRYSRRFKAAVAEIAPEIEDRGIDEIYIDLTDVPGDTIPLAGHIKDNVKLATGLSCSIGITPNKLLSKIASDLEKPNGLTVLDFADVPNRIWPLPCRKINGIGPRSGAN
jgi:DNA polymerase IV